MKLFRLRRKTKTGEEEKELVLDTDTDAKMEAPEGPSGAQTEPALALEDVPADPTISEAKPTSEAEAAEAPPEAPVETPAPKGDLLAEISAEAESELAAEEAAADGSSSPDDDPLDPELLDIFRDARNEVQESTLASELDDTSVEELLSDALAVSQRLGVSRQRPASESVGDAGEPSVDDSDPAEPDGDHEP